MTLSMKLYTALQDFNERIKMYKKKYVQVGKDEGSYIKVINVGTEVTGYQINGMILIETQYTQKHKKKLNILFIYIYRLHFMQNLLFFNAFTFTYSQQNTKETFIDATKK